jgi:hypothetical protein
MINITSKLTRSSRYAALSAAFLLQAHSAFANESFADASDQARALLHRPVVTHVVGVDTGTSKRVSDRLAPHPDAQELARALLLGQSKEPRPKAEGGQSNSAQSQLAYFDPQEAARRMILGNGEATVTSTHLAVSRH